VNHIGAGCVISDEIETVGTRRSRSGLDCFAAKSGLTRLGRGVDGLCVFADFDFFADAGKLEREVAKRSGIRDHCQIGGVLAKAITGNANGVTACGYGVELKFPVIVAQRFAFPTGILGLQLKVSAGDRAMLYIVDDAAHSAENAGERGADKTDGCEKQKDVIARAGKSLQGQGVFSKLELAARR